MWFLCVYKKMLNNIYKKIKNDNNNNDDQGQKK